MYSCKLFKFLLPLNIFPSSVPRWGKYTKLCLCVVIINTLHIILLTYLGCVVSYPYRTTYSDFLGKDYGHSKLTYQ